MATKSKHIIFSNKWHSINEDDYAEAYHEFLDMNDLTEDEYSFDEWLGEEQQIDFEAEVENLNVSVCGDILVIAQLGLWNGNHQGYKILSNHKLNEILYTGNDCDQIEYYADRYNICAKGYHHDGRNSYLFREIKDGVNIDNLLDKIYNGEEISSQELCRYTKSIRPYVANVYGW